MRHVMRIVANLYPHSWRERYGEEFAALLDDVNPGAGTAFNILTGAIGMQIRNWRLGWAIAISAAVASAAFGAMLVVVPKTYVSQGTLLLGQGGLDSLQAAAQRVESRMVLASVITSEKLYLRERSRMPTEDVLDLMRRDVKVEPARQGSQSVIAVAFNYPDPQIAQRVTAKLLASFVDQGLRALNPASLPLAPTRSVPRLAAVSGVSGLVMLGLLSFLRRRAI